MKTQKDRSRYSPNEIKLVCYFGYEYLLEIDSVSEPTLYRMMVEKAFLEGCSGGPAEALRKGARAVLVASQPYRGTPEFEQLIYWERHDES